jgi:O-antigen ligase
MIKAVNWCDRVMYGALLLLVFFIPYSSAMIQGSLIVMMLSWITKRSLIWKLNPQQGWRKSFSLPSTSLQWPLLLIGGLILLTMPFSHDVALTLKKFFSRFLQQIILMYLVLEAVKTPKRFYLLLVVLVSTLLAVHLDILVQYFSGKSFIFSTPLLYGRVSGPMRHPNDLGTLLVTVIPVLLALVITRRFWTSLLFGSRFVTASTVIVGSLLFMAVMALGLTSSRGAWLAFAVTMISFGVILKKPWWTLIITGMVIVFFLGFGSYCMQTRSDISPQETSQSQIVVESESSIKDTLHSAEKVLLNSSRRYEYWHTALEVIKQYPLFGCGYNAYIQTLKKLQLKPEEYPHNSLMQITAELGVVGLLAHLFLFVSLFWGGIKVMKTFSVNQDVYTLGIGLWLGLLAWLIHSFTDTAWQSLSLSILWWLMIGLLISFGHIAKQLNLSNKGEQ